MKARVPTYNPKVTRAMKAEIARQGRAFSKDIQTMLLWTLHKHYGFGKMRLEKFYVTFHAIVKAEFTDERSKPYGRC